MYVCHIESQQIYVGFIYLARKNIEKTLIIQSIYPMAVIRKITEGFINATDYLKDIEGLKHGEICQMIGLKRWQYDQIRIGRRSPTKEEINILTRKYVFLSKFFNDSWQEKKGNFDKNNELIESLRETIKTKNEVISLLKERLKNAIETHAETLQKIYTEDEAKIEYERLLKEYKKEKGNK